MLQKQISLLLLMMFCLSTPMMAQGIQTEFGKNRVQYHDFEWNFYETIPMLREFSGNRMFPMTLDGLTQGMKCLRNPKKTYDNNPWDLEDL